ncbi:zinc finger BED domain-containing protein RICESLEEPER 1 [Dendrobium catenatum]|uniref:AC transposase n=1 Tax=Dendrobium catenatum TaxID=906689 RepID=A0A2I0VVK0_9ASPA|nr:zinc finger BED domain-containing protein RICESLEEPER 1 [Dendrobium catenatum]XP_020672765.1 zinc finger BED domain-containing protein RICESLEEPER 1 [Dendrobium catenatum]PKU67427.1 Putative AC transposase [Dendrobium catenatum]
MAESIDLDGNQTLVEALPALHNPRARRLRSLVWNDFTKKQKLDGNYEAICNHCAKKFTANSRSGTTHLRNHLNFCLSTRRTDGRKRGKKQLIALKSTRINNYDKDGHGGSQFDQEVSRQDLSRMIILHEYPLEIIKQIGFQTFIRNLQPRFKLVSEEMFMDDCLKIYENGKSRLSELLETLPCRVGLTMDRWGSNYGAEYLCLTCHFVDNDWKLQRKMLNLLHFEAPPTAEDIFEGIMEKLHDWKISRKLSCMGSDQCVSDQVAADNLLLNFLRSTDSLHLNGDLFLFHGLVHVLDVVAQESMVQILEICERVRSCVIFVKSSHEKLKRFQNAAMLADAPKKNLVLDVSSNWRSTYLMIATVYEFQNAFKNLEEYDSDFSFDVEWGDVKSVKECLETFDHMIKKFSGIRVPTANHYFIDICGILLLLNSWSSSPVPVIAKLASQMLKGFKPYWDANIMVLAIASILDPRYKMKSVEYFFKKIYIGDYEAKMKVESIFSSLRNLYSEYVVHSANSKSDQALLCYTSGNSGCLVLECGTSGGSHSSSHITLSDTRRGLDQYLQQTLSSQSIKSDFDLYLEEPVYIYKDGPDDSFNVLAWWKLNAAKYPILSLVARDTLPIPLGNVTTRIEDRPLSQYLNSLNPLALQSMVCAQDWLRGEMEANVEEVECSANNIVVKL